MINEIDGLLEKGDTINPKKKINEVEITDFDLKDIDVGKGD